MRYTRRELVQMGVIFVSYFVTAEIGIYLHSSITAPALIWPPAGITLASFIICGEIVWPAIFFASILELAFNGFSPVLVIAVSAANVLQGLIGLFLLRKYKLNSRLERLQDTFTLGIVAFFVTMIVPAVGTIINIATGRVAATAFSATWGTWWAGEIMSVMVVTPLILRWIPRPRLIWNFDELVEGFIAFGFLVLIDLFLYWTPYTALAEVSLVYVTLIPLFWISLRMGVRATTLALAINAALMIIGTGFVYAVHHTVLSLLGERFLQSEIFIIMISSIFLILSSVAEERKNVADALRDHIVRLEEAVERISIEDDAKSQFIAILAHELRNPLAPLVSSLEIMEYGDLSAKEQGELISDMHNSIHSMRRLLNDLLDISRISRRKLILDKENVEIQQVVERSLRMIEPLMREQNHTLSVLLPPQTTILEADPVRLEQILVNLLNNAAKYTPPGGEINLTIEAQPGMVMFRVKDNGIGIDKSLIKNIFDPFMQVDRGEQKMGGLGIGLSLTSSLVEMHGGTIEARSAGIGKGSEFIVRLPYIGLGDDPFANLSSSNSTYFNNFMRPDFKILVVDDNQTAAKALQKLLTLRGYEVSTSFSGLEALEHAPQFEPKVIMLDIGLPDIDGYEVARRLREVQLFSGTLIALTGYGQENDKRFAENAGFDYHLTKPASLAEIEAILSKVS